MTPTPHIDAQPGDIAKTVLMPGDPLRAKFIADNFLQDPVQFNQTRGMLGFTGSYKGVPVSVMGSGMGCPSIGIYSYELFHFYGVENIMRVGTAGAVSLDLHIGDIVLGQAACTNSAYVRQYNMPGEFAPIASFGLLEKAAANVRAKGLKLAVGNVLSSDTFYDDDTTAITRWQKMGILCVEMEAAALYMNAIRAGKNALTILTISDEIFTGKATTALERQTAFTNMMEVALETAAQL
ncbi:MAG: purine-nucleoside phosphorylase [Defluviitaleaceae bacterium]|nr:purine-nucleoside phosphorylase [Defluviitaleaceae bacterium]